MQTGSWRWGDGPLLVLAVHGLGSQAAAWSAAGPLLADRLDATVVAPDLPGAGSCPGGEPGTNGLDHVVARLLSLTAERDGDDDVVVCGNSMGGVIAVRAAGRLEGRCRGVVVVDMPTPVRLPGPLARLFGGQAPAAVAVGLRAAAAVAGHPRLHRVRDRLLMADPEAVESHLLDELRARPRGAARALAEQAWDTARHVVDPEGLRRDLDELTAPLLAIAGDRDRLVPARAAVALAGRRPGTEVVVLPDAGHVPQLERPAAFVEAVTAWLKGLPSVPSPSRRPATSSPSPRR